MIEGSCHCGAIRFELQGTPEWLTRCNCSYCRRSNGLWAHGHPDEVSVSYDPGAVVRYVWGDKTLANVSCGVCGCTTHWEPIDPQKHPRMGVNCSMSPPEQIAGLRIRHFDGAESWTWLD